jgi:tetratricopeptide (TPR) repeat protein
MGAKKKAETEAPQAVIVTTPKSRISRKLAGTVILVLVLILVGALVYTRLTPPGDDDTQAIPKGKTGYDQLAGSNNKFTAKKDYDAAVEQWDKYLKDDPNGEYAYAANLQAGSLEQSKGDNDKALVYYQAAEKIAGKRTAHLQPMATIYELKGDKAKAAAYYQKYHDNFPANYPARDEELKYLENKIKQLEQ